MFLSCVLMYGVVVGGILRENADLQTALTQQQEKLQGWLKPGAEVPAKDQARDYTQYEEALRQELAHCQGLLKTPHRWVPNWPELKPLESYSPFDFKADYNEYFNENRIRVLNDLDAKKECAHVTCIYNDLNWFIEDLINSPEKLKTLKKGVDFQDYFL